MIRIKAYLDVRSPDREGRCPLKVAISKKGHTAYLPTGIRIKKEEWNGAKIVRTPNADLLNMRLADIRLAHERRILSLEEDGKLDGLSIYAVRDRLLNGEESVSFESRYTAYMESRRARRTREIYMATLDRMREYDSSLSSRNMEDITRVWLKGFDRWLEGRSPSPNARNIHFRNIRAVFNDAIDDGVTSAYPFRKFAMKTVPTVKRSLSVEELRGIMEAPLPPEQERYRDYFMLMFYLIGINTVDLCGLKGIHDGKVEYRRAKTGRIYSIKVEPEAMEIIDRHRGKNQLLDIMDGYRDYLYFANRLNHGLHAIRPGLSAYWARHTWATIAAELDIPKETIAAALGHSYGSSVTDIYIKFDQNKVDEANRRVIDHVLYADK